MRSGIELLKSVQLRCASVGLSKRFSRLGMWAAVVLGGLFMALHVAWWVVFPAMGIIAPHAGTTATSPEHVLFATSVVLATPFIMAFLMFSAVAQTLTGYLLLSLGSLALIVLGWRANQPVWPLRLWLGVGALAVVAVPLTVNYHAPMEPEPGHVMRWPTDPGLVAGVVKRVLVDFDGTPCAFRLIEWGDDGTLYYQSRCDGENLQSGVDRLWSFHPARDRGPHAVLVTPNGSTPSNIAKIALGLQSFQVRQLAGLRRFNTAHPDAPAIHAEPSLTSPDGHWVATVVAEDYEPTDIVIVSR